MLLKPCGHIGGDLVGMFSPAKDLVGFYSIDVSGHGITSPTSKMVVRRTESSFLNAVASASDRSTHLCVFRLQFPPIPNFSNASLSFQKSPKYIKYKIESQKINVSVKVSQHALLYVRVVRRQLHLELLVPPDLAVGSHLGHALGREATVCVCVFFCVNTHSKMVSSLHASPFHTSAVLHRYHWDGVHL